MRLFWLALLHTAAAAVTVTVANTPQRVAIVGAGPAGASAAYYLDGLIDADIHVFDRGPRAGGRTQSETVSYNNQTLHFETGASMFISVNRNLMDAAHRFNLTLCEHPCTGGHTTGLGQYGIWDPVARKWVVRMGGWLDKARMLWRYGLSDLRTVRRHTQTAVDEFMQSYTRFDEVFATWDEYLETRPAMKEALYYRAAEYYQGKISQRFLREVVSLATRVNYMQDVSTVNTLGAHISMAAESHTGYSIRGGNWQIFARMLGNATVHFNTTVTGIQRHQKYRIATNRGSFDDFDMVIVAAPLPVANIAGLDVHSAQFVKVYVTFAIGTLNSAFEDAPRLVVTPYHTTRPFNCMSVLACLSTQCAKGAPVLVKMFSHQPVELSEVFDHVEWHREVVWDAYPALEPRNSRYAGEEDGRYRAPRPGTVPIVLDTNLFYVNGMESLFSTMESQSVAARHVVHLALSQYKPL
ncbi:hypothetical protein GGI25_005034 [Coemansia spiralis]|uniref:Prenylcysteine lyase domain-containing protein n=2 Tax=Coemansia TaxID=4863 RepID=A0A9W8G5D6_9FUNG|nr:Prenylcysteine lyase-domain-containing protein [Coemansia spiralis]KAJ1989237.1 hypothetical protein EDC05_004825 [Coemansia umbellata]KAJ2620202.1 hypothetical protein GGI26_005218 [Coemansia sp. RSA 1358]KAJ2672662.1 hypothetical protein GGI25_005034 [Coemansia spiralis]